MFVGVGNALALRFLVEGLATTSFGKAGSLAVGKSKSGSKGVAFRIGIKADLVVLSFFFYYLL